MDLFPFLSILLCILGVMAFIQVLLSLLGGSRSQMIVDQAAPGQVAYQIVCNPGGADLLAPIEPALVMQASLPPGDRETVGRILGERRRAPSQHVRLGEIADRVLPQLRDIVEINDLARSRGRAYEEFLLIAVRPGGSGCYHRIRSLLPREAFRKIRYGLAPFGANWELSHESDAPRWH